MNNDVTAAFATGGGLRRRNFVARGAALLAGTACCVARSEAADPSPESAGPASPQLIQDLVAANRILAAEGLIDGYGHVSVRHDRNPNRYLLSRNLAPELVTADDIMEFDLDSRPVDTRRRTYIEVNIHGEIYKARPDVKVVVHSHSPELIPFGVTDVALRPMYHMSSFIGQGVPVFDIRKSSGTTDLIIRSSTQGRALAQSLGNHSVALMRGHGAVVVASTVPRAVGRSIYLQMNARLQREAMAMGGNIAFLDAEEAQKVESDVWDREGYERAWELWRRRALAK